MKKKPTLKNEKSYSHDEQLFRLIFEQHSAIMLLVEPETGAILDANRAAADFYGYSKSKLGEMSINEINALSPEQVETERHQALLNKKNIFIFTHKLANGENRIVEVHSTAIDLHGKQVLFSIIHDITERKQAEEALKKSERKYRLLFENMEEGFALQEIITDENGKVVDFRTLDANAAYERHIGLKREHAIGRTISEVIPQVDLHQVENYGRVALTGEPMLFEYHSKTFNRHLRVRTFSPQPRQFATIFEDITERKHAEMALRESEEKFRTIIDTSPDAIGLFDANANITAMNPSAARVFGFAKSEDMLGMNALDFFLPEDRQRAMEVIQEIFTAETVQNVEFMLSRKDGTLFVSEFSCSALYDQDQKPKGIIAITRDITERKTAEDALRESEEKYHSVVMALNEGLLLQNAAGEVLTCNPATEQILGLTPNQLMGQIPYDPDWQITREDGSPLPFEEYPAMVTLRTGKALRNVKAKIHKPSGELLWVNINSEPLFHHHESQPYAVVASFTDITERQRVEETLRESEARFRLAADSAPVLIWKAGPDAMCDYFNQPWLDFTGRTLEQEMGLGWAEGMHPDDYQNSRNIYRNMFRERRKYKMEYRLRHADGEYRWVLENAVPRFTSDGTFLGYIGSCVDISDRKQAENELLNLKKALEVANRTLQKALAREKELSHTDVLTGINNRRYLFEFAEHKLSIATRYKQPFAVMMIDIDHFKQVNDDFGHAAGDQVLIRVIEIIRSKMRKADFIGRYGGDEFIVLLPMTSAQQAYWLAERIRTSVADLQVPTEKGNLSVTLSIGIIEMRLDSAPGSVEELFNQADEAMYQAKQAGRNRTEIAGSDTP